MAGFYDGQGNYWRSQEEKERAEERFLRNYTITSSVNRPLFDTSKRDESGRKLGNY